MKIQIQELDKPNLNGRIYTTELIQRAIDQRNGEPIMGVIGIPAAPALNLADISHVVTKLEIEDGYLVGELKVLKTPKGNFLSTMLDDVAFRPCGLGVVGDDGVVNSYTLTSISAVNKADAA